MNRVGILLIVFVVLASYVQAVAANPPWMVLGAKASYSGFWTSYYTNGTIRQRLTTTLNWIVTAVNSSYVNFTTDAGLQTYPDTVTNEAYLTTARQRVSLVQQGNYAYEWIPTNVTLNSILADTLPPNPKYTQLGNELYRVEVHDPRYLVSSPCKCVYRSAWILYFWNQTSETPDTTKQFDYDAITDVLLGLHYTSVLRCLSCIYGDIPYTLNVNLTSTNVFPTTGVPVFSSVSVLPFVVGLFTAASILIHLRRK